MINSSTIVVENLPAYVDATALSLFITQQGFYADNVKIEKKLDSSGTSIHYGYVAFPNSMVAQGWFQSNDVK